MDSLFIVAFFLLSLIFFVISVVNNVWVSAAFSLIGLLSLGWVIFGNSMNLVQRIGSLYWIIRDNGKKGDPIIGSAFMRQTDEPWLIGKGVQVRFFKYSVQIGICYPNFFDSEEDGVLNAMSGRYMEDSAKEIGNWK